VFLFVIALCEVLRDYKDYIVVFPTPYIALNIGI